MALINLLRIFSKPLSKVREGVVDFFPSHPRLRLELPKPINKMHRATIGGADHIMWNVKVRLITDQPCTIVNIWLTEKGRGDWSIDEKFDASTGKPVPEPIPLDDTKEFWLMAHSPRPIENLTLPVQVRPLSLHVRDHTRKRGRARIFPMTSEPQQIRPKGAGH